MGGGELARMVGGPLCATLLAVACGGGDGGHADTSERAADVAPPTYPAGTVLALDHVPILGLDVDRVADVIEELYPEYTRPHLRRLALTNVFLPRAAVSARFDVARAAMQARVESAREGSAQRDEADWEALGAFLDDRRGGHASLRLPVWVCVKDLELGAWHGPFEDVGGYFFARVLEVLEVGRDGTKDRFGPGLHVRLAVFPYLDELDRTRVIDEALEAVELHVVDPAWGALVPEAWKYKLRGNG